MDKFKPLIEYYRNIKNLSYDIYLAIALLIFSSGVHYMIRSISNKKPEKFKILMLPISILTILLIYRPYRLKLISQYEYYSLLLLLMVILYFINPSLL